jgi:hypothetical protein
MLGYHSIFMQGLIKITKTVSKGTQIPTEYQSGVLAILPQRSV